MKSDLITTTEHLRVRVNFITRIATSKSDFDKEFFEIAIITDRRPAEDTNTIHLELPSVTCRVCLVAIKGQMRERVRKEKDHLKGKYPPRRLCPTYKRILFIPI
jgi:hypothetical protein